MDVYLIVDHSFQVLQWLWLYNDDDSDLVDDRRLIHMDNVDHDRVHLNENHQYKWADDDDQQYLNNHLASMEFSPNNSVILGHSHKDLAVHKSWEPAVK